MQPLLYTGTKLNQRPVLIERDGDEETINPYIPSPELVKAVNLALLLERPLLVMGEPGCGKSKLAQAVAYELYHNKTDEHGNVIDYRNYYREWFVKSTSKAQEGLYEYDAIRRLADAQIAKTEADRKALLNRKYWELGPMGEAFDRSTTSTQRVVLLIDEIDKADIDFPNDLLNEIDNGKFKVSETREQVKAVKKPIVIITSNAEKDLPDAFLRRCLYHYIQFDETKLKDIIVSRFHQNGKTELTDKETLHFIDKAKTAFLTIRKRIETEKEIFGGKNVSTSEFLDWYRALDHYRSLDTSELPTDLAGQAALDQLKTELALLDGKATNYPFAQALFKNYSSWLKFASQTAS